MKDRKTSEECNLIKEILFQNIQKGFVFFSVILLYMLLLCPEIISNIILIGWMFGGGDFFLYFGGIYDCGQLKSIFLSAVVVN